MTLRYVISRDSVTFNVDGTATVIPKTHPQYDNILATLATGDLEAVRPLLVDTRQYIADNVGDGLISYRDGNLYFGDEVLHNALATRIVALIRDGIDATPVTLFLRNLMDNPSFRSVQQLYGFLEKCDLPLTSDGHFVAYKVIRKDWKDKRTGTMDNSIGAKPAMRRNEVDDNPNSTCSRGLHFCSRSYIESFRSGDDRLVAVKVNPRDVVSIPVDYNNAKGRACEYTILRELKAGQTLPVNYTGFRLLVDDPEPVVTVAADGTRSQSRVGERVYTQADYDKAKRLLAEPDATLSSVARETGMHRRTVGRIRDGELG